jgi:YcaO-like protein with predicted kinase domain
MFLFGNEQRSPKRFQRATHRIRSPRETLEAFVPMMPGFGITRLANVTGLDRIGLPVYMAVRPNARSLAVSQGKGFDHDAAKASALMESIELWHAERVELPIHTSSFSALERAGVDVLDPRRLPRPVSRTYDEDAQVAFVEGVELLSRRPVLVPLEVVCLDFVRELPGTRMFLQCTNGLASGNDLVEAAVHGLCELIERDAMVLWFLDRSRSRTKASQIDPSTVEAASARALLDHLAATGIECAAWDMTSDIGVPAYAAALVDPPGWRAKAIAHGFGCHLSPEVALARALTEAAQCRLTEIAGSRDDIPPEQYAPVDQARTLRLIQRLREPAPSRDFRARQDRATATVDGDLEAILGALRQAGISTVAAVDLSRAGSDVSVVRVVIPELEAYTHGVEVTRGPRAQRWLERLAKLDAARNRKEHAS